MHTIARSELILGGQKSGKSRRAEMLARQWLAQSPAHRALLVATGQPWDDEMRARIARHQRERAERVPGLATVEEPRDLAAALARHGAPGTLLVIDCLTLWLTNWLMPASAPEYEPNQPPGKDWKAQAALFWKQFGRPPGPWYWWATKSAWGSFRWGARCAPSSMRWARSTSRRPRPARALR